MRLTAPLIAAVTLAGCRQGPDTTPAAYAKLSDRMRATLSWFPWVDDICVKNERRVPDEYCFRFDTPRRWSGVLTHDDYAGNRFYPGLTDYVATQNLPPSLTFKVANAPFRRNCEQAFCRPLGARTPDEAEDKTSKVFYVEFIGRRTKVEGPYGHTSMFGHLILIDRMILERRLPEPAKVSPSPPV